MYLGIIFMFSVLGDIFWTCYMSILMSIFLKIFRDFFRFFEPSVQRFARLVRVRSATPRPIWNGARRVDGQDRDFESCTGGM